MADHPSHKCQSGHESATQSTTSRDDNAGIETFLSRRFVIQDLDIVGSTILIRAVKQRGENKSAISRVFVIDFSNFDSEPPPFQNNVLAPFSGDISEEGGELPEILVFDYEDLRNECGRSEILDEIRYLRDERNVEEQDNDYEMSDRPPASDLWMFR